MISYYISILLLLNKSGHRQCINDKHGCVLVKLYLETLKFEFSVLSYIMKYNYYFGFSQPFRNNRNHSQLVGYTKQLTGHIWTMDQIVCWTLSYSVDFPFIGCFSSIYKPAIIALFFKKKKQQQNKDKYKLAWPHFLLQLVFLFSAFLQLFLKVLYTPYLLLPFLHCLLNTF